MTDNLPKLINRAAQALAAATNAAEVLEAGLIAKAAYDEAKIMARLSQMREAHEEIVEACHRVMADALVIETQAQCRVADEYDAAQKSGAIRKAGQPKKSIPANSGNTFGPADINLTTQQISEARKIRDAEKKKPGVIQRTLDEQLKQGKEPTRAVVKRAIAEPKVAKQKSRSVKQTEMDNRNAKIIKLAKSGWSAEEIGREFELVPRVINRILEIEKARSGKAESIELSMTAQEKLEAAIRQGKRKLEAEFDAKLRTEVRKRLEDTILPAYNESYSTYKEVIKSRKGVMDASTYKKVLFCLHPDRIANLKDNILTRRFDDAFAHFTRLKKLLLSEKEDPTEFPKMPSTYEELMRARQQVMEKRRAQRAARETALSRR